MSDEHTRHTSLQVAMPLPTQELIFQKLEFMQAHSKSEALRAPWVTPPPVQAAHSFGKHVSLSSKSFEPMQAGAFKIGDTAGTLENIIACKLHRPGSVGFVSKSGGMSNEMYNVLARATDGLFEGEGFAFEYRWTVGCPYMCGCHRQLH